MKKNLVKMGLIPLITAIFSGCVSKMQAPQNSGFFQSYDNLNTNSFVFKNQQDLGLNKKVYVEDVVVIPSIAREEQTKEQKDLYIDISKYATASIKEALKSKISDSKTENTMILQAAVSASEVHFDDTNWNQLSPLALGINVVSLNAYLEESARVVGEYRLLSGEKTVVKSINLIKNIPISLEGENLTLEDIKAPIDAWVKSIASELK